MEKVESSGRMSFPFSPNPDTKLSTALLNPSRFLDIPGLHVITITCRGSEKTDTKSEVKVKNTRKLKAILTVLKKILISWG